MTLSLKHAVAGVLSLTLLVFLAFIALRALEHCDRFEELLAADSHGRKVVSTFDACTLVGTRLDDEVFLVSPPGHRELIFSFGPNPGIVVPKGMEPELAATWLPNGDLEISVGAVTGIDVQKSRVDGIEVHYKVGMVIPMSKIHPNRMAKTFRPLRCRAYQFERNTLFRPSP